MTDEKNVDLAVAESQNASGIPVQQEEIVAQEKMVPQSEVDKIAAGIRQKAYEKARREMETAQPQAMQSMPEDNKAQQVAQGAVDEEKLRELVIQETIKAQEGQARQYAAQRVVQDFSNKLAAGATQYEDFEDKISQLELPKIPEIVALANGSDNTADVMYELASNPSKVGNLMMLIKTAPHLAKMEMQKLSSSIKANKEAQQAAQPPEPLSQIRPSTASVDSGKMSVSDLRKMDWLKG